MILSISIKVIYYTGPLKVKSGMQQRLDYQISVYFGPLNMSLRSALFYRDCISRSSRTNWKSILPAGQRFCSNFGTFSLRGSKSLRMCHSRSNLVHPFTFFFSPRSKYTNFKILHIILKIKFFMSVFKFTYLDLGKINCKGMV